MNLIKRFAFWPLLALIAMTIASAASNPVHGSTAGQVVGLTASVPSRSSSTGADAVLADAERLGDSQC